MAKLHSIVLLGLSNTSVIYHLIYETSQSFRDKVTGLLCVSLRVSFLLHHLLQYFIEFKDHAYACVTKWQLEFNQVKLKLIYVDNLAAHQILKIK